jgi:UDP-N-acetylglucosamine 4,6-dehydratase
MTRFWITLEQSVNLVLKALEESEGGEVFVPKIPSMRIIDVAKAINPSCRFKTIGIRPGEKIHETLISEDEVRATKIFDGIYVILPQFFNQKALEKYESCPCVGEGFVYRSDTNDEWVSEEDLERMINQKEAELVNAKTAG